MLRNALLPFSCFLIKKQSVKLWHQAPCMFFLLSPVPEASLVPRGLPNIALATGALSEPASWAHVFIPTWPECWWAQEGWGRKEVSHLPALMASRCFLVGFLCLKG